MAADKTYLAVPTVTAITIVRAALRSGREYTNQITGQSIQRLETEGRRAEITMTTYQPVVRDGVVVRFTDLGDDTFNYPDVVPVLQSDAGGPTVTAMDEILDAEVLKSLRDVLVEVMTGTIPDFAEQPPNMVAIGVPRFFHIDRIQFSGRADRSREAYLKVLLGVYEDVGCTVLKKYIQQDFVSAAVIAEKQKLRSDLQSKLTTINTELSASTTTDERKTALTAERESLLAKIDEVTNELEDLQPLSEVLKKDTVKEAIKDVTESALRDAVKNRQQYSAIVVDELMARFDSSWTSFVSAVSKT